MVGLSSVKTAISHPNTYVSLTSSADSVSGTHEVGIVTADSIMLRAGVAETKHLDKGLRIEYESCIFRVCSKLNYR